MIRATAPKKKEPKKEVKSALIEEAEDAPADGEGNDADKAKDDWQVVPEGMGDLDSLGSGSLNSGSLG